MATWTRGEYVTRTVRYTVPAGMLGADWNQVQQALDAAREEFTALSGGAPYDNSIRVYPRDDEIAIEFEAPAERKA